MASFAVTSPQLDLLLCPWNLSLIPRFNSWLLGQRRRRYYAFLLRQQHLLSSLPVCPDLPGLQQDAVYPLRTARAWLRHEPDL